MAVNIDYITGGRITANITINVPSDYSTIQSALTALSGREISESAEVTIQIADGTYTINSPLILPRSVGKNLKILGNLSSPSSVVLSFPSGTNGFQMEWSQSLRWINGMTIDGVNSAPSGVYTAAFLLNSNSQVFMGSAMVLKRFSYGISANLGSVVQCPGITVANNLCGIASNGSASVFAHNVTATNNTNNGFYANWGGNIVAYGATATGSLSGFFADQGGAVYH
jgi:hypothetical protein